MKNIILLNAKKLKYLYSILCPYDDETLLQDADFCKIEYLEEYITFFKGDSHHIAIAFTEIASEQINLLKEHNL